MLYLFAGAKRPWDVATCIKESASAAGWDATVECVDICRRASPKLPGQDPGESFRPILLSPPCSSFSIIAARARSAAMTIPAAGTR